MHVFDHGDQGAAIFCACIYMYMYVDTYNVHEVL